MIKVFNKKKRVRLMFQDEAGFGRINKPKQYWYREGSRPRVPCHHIGECRYVYGAADPVSGDGFFLVLPYCNTVCINLFLEHLSVEYPDDYIVLVCDGAVWHKSGSLKRFPNIEVMFIPPYTPEMNPIEQNWKELRARGFHNEVFQTLEKAVDRLCDTSAIYLLRLFAVSPVVIGLLNVLIRDWYHMFIQAGMTSHCERSREVTEYVNRKRTNLCLQFLLFLVDIIRKRSYNKIGII